MLPRNNVSSFDVDDDEVGRLSDCVRRALECPVCLELPCSISTCCENGHGLCDQCSYKLMQLHRDTPPLCPVCRSAYGRGQDVRVTTAQPPPPATAGKLFEIMSVTRVACAFRPQGCPELAYVSLVSLHEAFCPYASHVRCMVAMCRWMGVYHDAFLHVAVEHQFSAYDVLVTYPPPSLFSRVAFARFDVTLLSPTTTTFLRVRCPDGKT